MMLAGVFHPSHTKAIGRSTRTLTLIFISLLLLNRSPIPMLSAMAFVDGGARGGFPRLRRTGRGLILPNRAVKADR